MNTDFKRISDFIVAFQQKKSANFLPLLEELTIDSLFYTPLMRMAIYRSGESPLYYRQLLNLWSRTNFHPLKPSVRKLQLEVLSDGTVNGIEPYLQLFCAPFGIHMQLLIGEYDSVEHQAFVCEEQQNTVDMTLVVLSDHWLQRQLNTHLPTKASVEKVKLLLTSLVSNLKKKRTGQLLFTSFAGSAFPPTSSSIVKSDHLGWSTVLYEINLHLHTLTDSRVALIDTMTVIQLAGGQVALGMLNFLRARAPFEEAGLIMLARELASSIAHIYGRSHRALLTDWDNTLWGGEVGELGVHGIRCGQNTPEEFGYSLLQTYLKQLNQQGILLAAVSRNDPLISRVLEENNELVLRREHFAKLALSWGSKSESIREVQQSFNFSTEFMLYIDDSPFELAEVLVAHPYIDIIPAGPEANDTLKRLIGARFFNSIQLTEDDFSRGRQAQHLSTLVEALSSEATREDFLNSLNIKLYVSDLNSTNKDRVLQLLQKTNQFNLTTKRYTNEDISKLQTLGAEFGVFRYADNFGSQGIIGLIILVKQDDEILIDTWLMSCRVLNRTVENAMFSWVIEKARSRTIRGIYIPTEKNFLVKDLYPRLDFIRDKEDEKNNYSYVIKKTIELVDSDQIKIARKSYVEIINDELLPIA